MPLWLFAQRFSWASDASEKTMKLKYLLTAFVMVVVCVGWSLLDQRSFGSYWWVVAIGGFALSGAFVAIDGKTEA